MGYKAVKGKVSLNGTKHFVGAKGKYVEGIGENLNIETTMCTRFFVTKMAEYFREEYNR